MGVSKKQCQIVMHTDGLGFGVSLGFGVQDVGFQYVESLVLRSDCVRGFSAVSSRALAEVLCDFSSVVAFPCYHFVQVSLFLSSLFINRYGSF